MQGAIRLAGFGSNSSQGRVEVCLNNQWGTVCDDFWGATDAGVACGQLGFSRYSGFLFLAWSVHSTELYSLEVTFSLWVPTILPVVYARGNVIGCVHLSLSVCLSAQKCQFSRSSRCISAKYLQTVLNFEKLPCLCFHLLDTFYKCLKSCIWSWYYGHTYYPHPDNWPCVNIHIGACRAVWVPGQNLAVPHLMCNCRKRI